MTSSSRTKWSGTISISARRLLSSNCVVEYPSIHVQDGYIRKISARDEGESPARTAATQSFPDGVVVPSYIDLHVHGASGFDFMEATPEALRVIEAFLASRGVGGFFATTATSSIETTLRTIDLLSSEVERGPSAAYDGAVPLGIHLEGPFISCAKRGAHPAMHIQDPSIGLFERFWQAARGHIRIMTIAPELPNALELIEYASSKGVRCSLGHSNATFEEASAGFRAGARSATHTFNAMSNLDHRDPGLAAYVLDNQELFAEVICDGIHVAPALIRLLFKAKGTDRALLITDGSAAMGMGDGEFIVRGRKVYVSEGCCTVAGKLAGSVSSMDQAVRNFMTLTCSTLSSAIHLATHNPAQLAGIEDKWGRLEEGREANMLVLSPAGEIQQVFRAGRPLL